MKDTSTNRAVAATAEHVTREVNLIARNFECLGIAAATAATADHVRRFWAPLLRSELLKQARAHRERFSPIATDAISMLEQEAG
jgi:hypothetical protein